MAENKASPQLWATVTIAVAVIACLGTITSAIIAKIPVSTPIILVVTETPSSASAGKPVTLYADVNDTEIGNVKCVDWTQCWNTPYGYFFCNRLPRSDCVC